MVKAQKTGEVAGAVCGQHSHIAVRIHEVERSGAQVKQADAPCDVAKMIIVTVKLKRFLNISRGCT